MNKAAAVLGLVAGIFGFIAAIATLLLGGAASAFGASDSNTMLNFGWGGIFFSFIAIIFGALAFAKPRLAGWGLMVSSVLGAILGGTLVAICMVLAFVAGILALLGSPSGAANDTIASTSMASASPRSWLRVVGWTAGGVLALLVLLAVFSSPTKDEGLSNDAQRSADAIAQLSAATASALQPAGELAEIFEFGSNSTAVQRDNTAKAIDGKVVIWQLRVFEVKRDGNVYLVSTSSAPSGVFGGNVVVSTSITLAARNNDEARTIEAFKTGDTIRFKGRIKGVGMRRIQIEPAMLWPKEASNAAPASAPSPSLDVEALQNRFLIECSANGKRNAIALGGMQEDEAERFAAANCAQSTEKFNKCAQTSGASYAACYKLSATTAE